LTEQKESVISFSVEFRNDSFWGLIFYIKQGSQIIQETKLRRKGIHLISTTVFANVLLLKKNPRPNVLVGRGGRWPDIS
jgi:hypothetical protein